MIPSWIVNTLVIILGCIFAIYFGSALPEFGELSIYLVGFLIISTICLVTNNFPALLALALWYPISLPVPFFRAFPTVALVLAWFSVILFFKLCMDKTLIYIRSFNWLFLFCFAWVPVRFLLNPIHHLGAGVGGGKGVSGANAYFLYALAGVILVSIGFILTNRKQILNFMRWSFLVVLLDGLIFLVCAFIPSTGPFLASVGMFAAGNLTDNILRIVVLPGYGLFLIQAVLCPGLFPLPKVVRGLIFIVGAIMIVVGGNRSAVAATIIAIPVILFLRRQFGMLALSGGLFVIMLCVLNLWLHTVDTREVSGLARGLGIFSSKIDKASGGSASAAWRYAVWQSGLEKIAESPIIGKGFGNLDKHLEVNDMNKIRAGETDFEIILAGGEAHNGFISAAYGFGVPFMITLSLGIFWRIVVHVCETWRTDPRDAELRDFHAFLAGVLVPYPLLIYTAFDICSIGLWVNIGVGLVMQHLTRNSRCTRELLSIQSENKRELRPTMP